MPRRKPPSRLRYEAEHPSLTVRVSMETKTKVLAAAKAQGLSVSEWVQAMAAGQPARAADAYRRGQEDGRKAGEASGYLRGQAEGLAAGRRQGRKAQAILDAAVLWTRYGDQIGSTDDCWFDQLASRWVVDLSTPELDYLRSLLVNKPQITASVRRWLRDSDLPAQDL